MSANPAEVVAGMVLVGFSLFAWNEAAAISGAAAMFPTGVIAVLLFFSVVYLLRAIFRGRATEPMFPHVGLFAVVLVGSLAYTQLVVTIGYVTSTVLFIPLISWLIGFRRPVYIAVVTVVYVATADLLFEVAFNRPMPEDPFLLMLRSLL